MLTSSYLAVKTRFAGWARAIEAAIKELVKPASSVPALAADAGGDPEGRIGGRTRTSDEPDCQIRVNSKRTGWVSPHSAAVTPSGGRPNSRLREATSPATPGPQTVASSSCATISRVRFVWLQCQVPPRSRRPSPRVLTVYLQHDEGTDFSQRYHCARLAGANLARAAIRG